MVPTAHEARGFCENWRCFNLCLLPRSMFRVAAFSITESLFLRLRKLVYSRYSLWWRCFRSEWRFTLFPTVPYWHYPHHNTITRLRSPWKTVVYQRQFSSQISLFYALVMAAFFTSIEIYTVKSSTPSLEFI